MSVGRVLVYGGRGALGAAVVSHFKSLNFWVGSIDLIKNEIADHSIILERDADWTGQETSILNNLQTVLNGEKLDAVFCVAGGWAGGNAEKNLVKSSELMWKQSVWTSIIAASLSTQYLKDGGILTLTGSQAGFDGTPGMIGYGMAKAAVHHLTKSLAGQNSGLPENSLVLTIVPVTLDTEANRKSMPTADYSSWTPLQFVADLFTKWVEGKDLPQNGSLIQLITKNNNTNLVIADK